MAEQDQGMSVRQALAAGGATGDDLQQILDALETCDFKANFPADQAYINLDVSRHMTLTARLEGYVISSQKHASGSEPTVYDNIMALLKPEPLMTPVKKKQTVPSEGGRTPRDCQKWPELRGLVHDWEATCNLKSRLTSHRQPAPAAQVYGTRRHPNLVQDEGQIYSCISRGINESVNDALEVLQVPARFVDASGSGRTEADLRVVIYGGGEERTGVPEEVKLDNQVRLLDGLHYVDAVRQGGASFKAVRQPLAQIFMYMVQEEAMYGILNTKTKYVFLKRDSDVASGKVYISETFDGETEPVGPILVWIATMAATQAPLPRGHHPATPLQEKWVTTRAQQAVLAAAQEWAAPASSAPDADLDGEGNAGSGPGQSRPPTDDDGDSSQAQTGPPSSNTRRASKRGRSTAGASSKKRRSLPHIEHELLEIGRTCHHGHGFLLREGKCGGRDALFKVVDLFKRPQALAMLEEEADIYEHMAAIQDTYVPRILQVGLSHGGGLGFMAMTAEGPSLADGCSCAERIQAKKALQHVHACGVLHRDVNASNFLRARPRADAPPGQDGIMLVDFAESIYVPSLCQKAKAEEIRELDEALTLS